MGDKDVLIIGYPKSGNTFLSRLLGDALDSPVVGLNAAHPVAEEGLNRPGPFTVRQLHLRPNDTITQGPALVNPWTYAPYCAAGERIINIVRDPRDVAVSAWKYWEIASLEKAIRCMGEGLFPLAMVGTWQSFVNGWAMRRIPNRITVKYEDLVGDTCFILGEILTVLGLPVLAGDGLEGVVKRQSFATRRKELAGSGSKYMYGETIQLKNMRKGIAGDWKNHFNPELEKLAEGYFGETMRRMGYVKD